MITQLKAYACGAVIVALITITVTAKYEVYYLTQEYNKYKEHINDQLQKAKIEKARIEAEQQAKHDREIADYAADLDRLNRILAGLRKSGTVPRETSVPVAGSSNGNMPRSPENTGITFTKLATRKGACESSFYADALETTLRCKRLIEFVKP